MKYVAYIRVSTGHQKESGLGLAAQQEAINKFIGPEDTLSFTFTEIESGRNNNRPELKKALEAAKDIGATLLVSKLDRLSRRSSFLFMLFEANVPIICCDFPQADRFMLKIMGIIAEWEAERIQTRIIEALDVKRKKGERLGKRENLTREGGIKGNETMRKRFLAKVDVVKPTILYMLEQKTPVETIIINIKSFYPESKFSTDFIRRAISKIKVQRALQD